MRFEDFAAARLPALLRYATLLSGDRDEAHDIVQDVLTRALVRWGRIGAVDEPYAYVRTMITNHFLSLRRRRRLFTVSLRDSDDRPQPPAPEPGDGDALWQLLATLPRQQRAVLVLRYYEGLGDDEISEVLGCRPSTVRGYASRALATLRIEMRAATMTNEGVRP
jgi:RNA polymerase sigma-70 factor (sigma-E family)